MLNKKQLQRIQAMLSATETHLLVRSLGEGQTMITGHEEAIVTNIILPVNSGAPFSIMTDQLNKFKAFVKDVTAKEEFEMDYLAEHFGSVVPEGRKNTDEVMAETSRSQIQADFHVDFKLLDKVVKATKEKSTIIRITKYDNDRLMVSTQEGAVSCVGTYIAS